MSNIKFTKGDGGDIESMLDDLSNVGYYPDGTAVNIDDNGLITIITPEDNEEEEVEQHTDELNGDDKTTTSSSASPYAKTREALESQHKSFSQTLKDMYEAREESRKKRTRTAKMAALGHAIGDLFGAIGAHYMSGKKNSKAVVPQPLAPKSYEKVQKLIDEGIADKNTFDDYMRGLTEKKAAQELALTQAEEQLAINAANKKTEAQQREALEAKKAQWRLNQSIIIQQLRDTAASLRQKERLVANETLAEKKAALQKEIATLRAQLQKEIKTAEEDGYDATLLTEMFPLEDTITKTTEFGTETTTRPHTYTNTERKIANNELNRLARLWNLNPSTDKQKIKDLYKVRGKRIQNTVLNDSSIAALLKSGQFTVEQILNFAK